MYNKKDYIIDIAPERSEGALAPTFTVTINHMLTSDIELQAKKNQPGFDISFKGNTIKISITPQQSFHSHDKLFRESYALLTRCYLSSRDSSAITEAYNKYLKDHHIESSFVKKCSKESVHDRGNSNTVS